MSKPPPGVDDVFGAVMVRARKLTGTYGFQVLGNDPDGRSKLRRPYTNPKYPKVLFAGVKGSTVAAGIIVQKNGKARGRAPWAAACGLP
jgi:hypothetical protein